jgi:solute carrier family 35
MNSAHSSSSDALSAQIERSSLRAAEKGHIAFAVAGYAICSSCMLVTNKVAVHVLPAPSLVLFAQLASAAFAVWGCGQTGMITVDALEIKKVLAFAPVALAFLGVIFANIKTLQYANVETFIVFRASTPLVITFCDCLFLGRSLPEARSWLSLVGLLAGAIGYVVTDAAVEVKFL